MLALVLSILAPGALAQYCTGNGPSSSVDSNIRNITLVGENALGYVPPCPGTIGVDDRTGTHVVRVSAGGNYASSSVFYSSCNGVYSQVGSVWVDWNRNFVWESSELVNDYAGFSGIGNFSLNVPPAAQSGLTRMRFMLCEGCALPLNPCATFTWGSVIDIAVDVTVTNSPTPTPTNTWSIRDSFADGPGVAPDQRINRLLAFTVWALDSNRNHVNFGGIPFTMVLYGLNTREAVPVNWTDYNDGSYGCRYTLTVADTYNLFISSGTEQISNSPITITATTEAEPSQA